MEHIARYTELRADGRKLAGVALRYNEVAPSFRERILPGAFDPIGQVPLNLVHDRLAAVAWTQGGGLTLLDSPTCLRMEAQLPLIPGADIALASVRRGNFSGLSVEFDSLKEHDDGGVRVIEKATLRGIGLVPRPAYPSSGVEARARKEGMEADAWARSHIPNAGGVCACCGDSVNRVEFDGNAWQQVLDSIARKQHRVSAHTGRYDAKNMVASTDGGSLILTQGRRGLDVVIRRSVMDTPAARELYASLPAGKPSVRPLIDFDKSEYSDLGGVRTYQSAALISLLIKWTPDATSWWDLLFPGDPDPDVPPPEGRAALPWWI